MKEDLLIFKLNYEKWQEECNCRFNFTIFIKNNSILWGIRFKKKYIIARQLLKSGTSIGANVREAQNAESKADFIHKLKISAKEADETEYWLTLCKLSKNYPFKEELLMDLNSIIKVLSKIISSSKNKK